MTDPLHRFATRVVELQARRDSAPQGMDEATMLAVARDLGMSEEEILRLREEARTAKTRAQALRRAGDLNGAVDVLETAHAFHPLDLDVGLALADGLYNRSQKPGEVSARQGDWQRARALVLEVLAAAPAHAEAASLLNAIQNHEPSRQDTSIPWGVVIGIGVVLLGILAAVALLVL